MTSDSLSNNLDAQALEEAAGRELGRLLFGFSRLEFSLNLALRWAKGGQDIERISQRLEAQSFHQKLEWLKEITSAGFPMGSLGQVTYSQWLVRADTARRQRNRLVHGRWGINSHTQEVINIVGIPGSTGQVEVYYKLQELQAIADEVSLLWQELDEYGRRMPLCNAASSSL